MMTLLPRTADRMANAGGSPGPSPARCPGAASGRPRRSCKAGPVRLGLYAGCGLRLRSRRGGSATVAAAGGVHGFPAALTTLIGRDGLVREVAGLLGYRLVTVTGPGGQHRAGPPGGQHPATAPG